MNVLLKKTNLHAVDSIAFRRISLHSKKKVMLIKDLQETHISARDAQNAIHKNHFPNGIVLLWFYFTSDYFLILNTWGKLQI